MTPAKTESLARLPLESVIVGDLDDLEKAARAAHAQLLIGSSHAVESAHRLGVPLLRAGFPQYDHVGGYARTWVGYRATRQALFDLANLMQGQHHELEPYRSIYRAEPSGRPGEPHVIAPAAAGLVH